MTRAALLPQSPRESPSLWTPPTVVHSTERKWSWTYIRARRAKKRTGITAGIATTRITSRNEDRKPLTPKAYARSRVSAGEWPCLNALWERESGWDRFADNPQSTAYGIAQMLTEASSDAFTQIRDGLAYIADRYGTPCEAWNHEESEGWY